MYNSRRQFMPKVVPQYKEDAKQRIIEAAMDVIAEEGSHQMTIDHVAKKLGVTKGAIYWYFKSKEELVAAVLKKFQTDNEKITFDSFYNRSLDEVFSQIFDRFSMKGEKQRAIFFEMSALSTRDTKVRHATHDYYAGLVAMFEEAIIREKKQHLILSDENPHTLAQLLVALYSGLQNYAGVWIYQEEIKDLWLEGVRNLLQRPENEQSGEEPDIA
jgi:AcrR family transcriptional regulator